MTVHCRICGYWYKVNELDAISGETTLCNELEVELERDDCNYVASLRPCRNCQRVIAALLRGGRFVLTRKVTT